MKCIGKSVLIILCAFSLFSLTIYSPSTAMAAKADKVPKVNAAFDASKMGDMSDFDPANPIIPTGIPSRLPWWLLFPVRALYRDRSIGLLLSGRSMTSTREGGSWSTAKRSWWS